MELKPGYKQTDLGMIPEGWECTNVRGIASAARNAIVGGPFGSDLVSADYVDHGVPVIRGQNMSGQWVSGVFVFVSPIKAKSLEANLARPWDIVFTQRGTLGQVSLVPDGPFQSYLVSQSQMKLSVKRDAADPLFFYYVFTSDEQQNLIHGGTIQTGVPHINLSILRDIPVQLPPLSEQRAIAAALSDVDALLAGLDRVIAKKRDLKQAAMQQLLTGQTRLPGFSGEWQRTRLDDLSTFITKGATPTTYGHGWMREGILFLRSECVAESGLDLGESMFISKAAHNVLRRSEVRTGDLLITITGNVGRVVFLDNSVGVGNINQHIARIRIIESKADAKFVYQMLSFAPMRKYYGSITTGQAYPQISLQQVRETVLVLPALAEQRAIAEALSDMDAELSALETRRDKTRALKQAMMQELLTGRTRLV